MITTRHDTAGHAGGWFGEYLSNPTGALTEALHHAEHWLRDWGPVLAVPAVLLAVLAVTGARRLARRRGARMAEGARLVTVLAPPTVDPTGANTVWSNLVGGLLRPRWRRILSGQPHVAFEYLFGQDGVAIRIWVPGGVPPGMVERAVEAAWPGAHTRIDTVDDPLPAAREGQRRIVAGGEMRLARPEMLPIHTDHAADPLRALLAAPTGLGRDETACVQILARPVTGRRVAAARAAARRLHNGGTTPLIGHLLDLITPGPITRTPQTPRSPGALDPQTSLEYSGQRRAIVAKGRGPHYETLVRYTVAVLVSVDASREEREHARDVAHGRAHAVAAGLSVYDGHNRYERRRRRNAGELVTQRRFGRGDLLSVPELAVLAHLPTDESIPGLQRAGARAVAPPPGIAEPGTHAKPLGVTDSGHARPVAVKVADARQHLHVLGATGSGKSTLLGNLILDDAEQGRGVVVVDPKGDLVTDILSRLPRRAADRVVLFDADSKSRPPCLNPLDGDPGDTDLIVDNLVSIFSRVYAGFWGPRTDDVMRAACLTLRLQDGVTTLADLPRLLADDAYRSRLTAAVTDPVLAGFWSGYEQLTPAGRAQVVGPLLNKLRAFLLRPFVAEALTAGHSTVDFPSVLDGGICLVRIPKGRLGEESTKLIGSLVVAHTWQATTARAQLPQRLRRDAGLYIDECHNFLNLPYSIEDMLAEARGFRLSMTLSHQHLGQLGRELREGISANARSKIYFAASPEDARDLARHTAPRVSEHDLAHLGAYHAAARLVLDGEQAQPFTFTTRPLPAPTPGRSSEIRRAAAARRDTTPPPVADDSRPARPATDPRRR